MTDPDPARAIHDLINVSPPEGGHYARIDADVLRAD
jgi:hypothetical protein